MPWETSSLTKASWNWSSAVTAVYAATPVATMPPIRTAAAIWRMRPCRMATKDRIAMPAPAMRQTLPSHPSNPAAVWELPSAVSFAQGRKAPIAMTTPATMPIRGAGDDVEEAVDACMEPPSLSHRSVPPPPGSGKLIHDPGGPSRRLA